MDGFAASDRCYLEVRRMLVRCDVLEPVDEVEVLTKLVTRLEARRDLRAKEAVEQGTSYAALGRAMGMSRQGARRRCAT